LICIEGAPLIKIKYILTIIIFWLLFLATNWGCDIWKTKEEKELIAGIKNFEIPLYENPKNVDYFSNNGGLIKGVTYNVSIYYPAQELISFYENKMAALGFTHFKEKNSSLEGHKWGFYEDGTITGSPDVAHLNISWVDERKRAILVLKYFWYGKTDSGIILENNLDLNVSFQIMAMG
jgi:hypothetical protein